MKSYTRLKKAELIDKILLMEDEMTYIKNQLDRLEDEFKSEKISSKSFSIFIDKFPLPTVVTDKKNVIKYVNRSFKEKFNYSFSDKDLLTELLENAHKDFERERKRKSKIKTFETKVYEFKFSNTVGKKVRIEKFVYLNQCYYIFLDLISLKIPPTDEEERKEGFYELFKRSTDMIFLWDYIGRNKIGKLKEVNESVLEKLGYSADELINFSDSDLLTDPEKAKLQEINALIFGKGEHLYYTRFKSKRGDELEIEVNAKVVKIERKKYVFSIARDISDRIKFESSVIKNDDRFNALLSSTPLSIEIFDKNGSLTYSNAYASQLWGEIKVSEVSKFNIFKDEFRREIGFTQHLEEVFGGKGDFSGEMKIEMQGAEPRQKFYRSYIFPISIVEDKVAEVAAVTEDITDRKIEEYKKRLGDQIFRKTVEKLPFTTLLYSLSEKGEIRLIGSNQAGGEFPGLNLKKSFGKSIDEMFPELLEENILSEIIDSLSAGKPYKKLLELEGEILKGAYEIVVFEPIPKKIILILNPIEHEQIGSAWGDFFIRLIDENEDSIIILNEEAKIIEWNQSAELLTGVKKDDALNRSYTDILFELMPESKKTETNHEMLLSTIGNMIQFGSEGIKKISELELQNNNGEIKFAAQRLFEIQTERGYWIGSILKDITPLKRWKMISGSLERISRVLVETSSVRNIALTISEECSAIFENDAFYMEIHNKRTGARRSIFSLDTPAGSKTPVEVKPQFNFSKPDRLKDVFEGKSIIIRSNGDKDDAELNPYGIGERRPLSSIFSPVQWKGTSIGLISVQSYSPEKYSEKDIGILKIIANLTGSILNQLKINENLKISERIEALIKRISSQFAGIAVNEIEDEIVNSARMINDFLKAEGLYVILLNFENKKFKVYYEFRLNQRSIKKVTDHLNLEEIDPLLNLFQNHELISYRSTGDTDEVSELRKKIIKNEESRAGIEIPVTSEGEILGVVGFFFDPSKFLKGLELHSPFIMIGDLFGSVYRRLERELRLIESEKHLDFVVSGADLGRWDWHIPSGGLEYNRRFAEILGYERDEIEHNFSAIEKLIHEDDRGIVFETLNKHLRGEISHFEIEHRIKGKDGDWRWVLNKGKVFERDSDGKPVTLLGTYQDLTRLKNTVRALRISEEKFRLLFENSILGIYQTEKGGKFHYVNSVFLKILGFESIEHLNAFDIQSSFDPIERRIFFETLERDKQINGYECSFKKLNGETIFLRESAKLIKDLKRREIIIGSIEDITEKKFAEEAILQAKSRAEESDQLKTEFIAQISHEIRTPINSILSFSNLIQEEVKDNITTDIMESWDIMEKAGERIIRTIDLILNMSQIQTGNYEVTPSKFDVCDLILEPMLGQYKLKARERNLSMILKKLNDKNVIKGDEYTVGQIFQNLIDNAIKYTEKGRIEIIVGKEGKKHVFVEVSDTGIGISDEFIPKLFEPFVQEIRRGYAKKYNGTGLGLSLVKKYCDLNNAEILVISKKGVGTKFKVIFPAE